MAIDNPKHTDHLFNYIFGSEENREWTLSLYNAVNKSNYTDPSLIEITTIKEIMYMAMYNDTSFMIYDEMNLYEHQSSYNPNMPYRMLEYACHLYDKYVNQTNQNKYGKKLMHLPAPRLVVFYNGRDEQPEEKLLKLSDSFPAGAISDIEVTVRMINVNLGKNKELMAACKPLAEYSWLIAEVRNNNKTKDENGASSAIDRAIIDMPKDYVIKPFLEAHKAEVKGMLLEEYNEAETMERFREEGREEGEREERVKTIKKVMEKLEYTAQQAMDFLDIPISKQSEYLALL